VFFKTAQKRGVGRLNEANYGELQSPHTRLKKENQRKSNLICLTLGIISHGKLENEPFTLLFGFTDIDLVSR
jgi:hypothetical protein